VDLSAQVHFVMLEMYPELAGPPRYDDPTEDLSFPPNTHWIGRPFGSEMLFFGRSGECVYVSRLLPFPFPILEIGTVCTMMRLPATRIRYTARAS
jgi:hypothetical protein